MTWLKYLYLSSVLQYNVICSKSSGVLVKLYPRATDTASLPTNYSAAWKFFNSLPGSETVIPVSLKIGNLGKASNSSGKGTNAGSEIKPTRGTDTTNGSETKPSSLGSTSGTDTTSGSQAKPASGDTSGTDTPSGSQTNPSPSGGTSSTGSNSGNQTKPSTPESTSGKDTTNGSQTNPSTSGGTSGTGSTSGSQTKPSESTSGKDTTSQGKPPSGGTSGTDTTSEGQTKPTSEGTTGKEENKNPTTGTSPSSGKPDRFGRPKGKRKGRSKSAKSSSDENGKPSVKDISEKPPPETRVAA